MFDIAKKLETLNTAIGLRAHRHQVLASNIANADTPGYKARDFDFRSAMQKAVGGQAGASGLALATTASRHLDGSASASPVALQFRSETQSAVDGNTVDMDVERSSIAENSLQYEVLTRLISDRFSGIRAALAGNQG